MLEGVLLKKISSKEKRLKKDHTWICSQNLSEFAGNWIAVYDETILASGTKLKNVMNKVKKKQIPSSVPLYLRVPESAVII